MSEPLIGIVLGSKSDLPQIANARALLDDFFEVPYEVRIISAHRTPEEAHKYASTAKERGLKAIIAMAGMAAHLAGVMAGSAQARRGACTTICASKSAASCGRGPCPKGRRSIPTKSAWRSGPKTTRSSTVTGKE